MFFSFILPAYKANYLRESINSILRQDFSDFELIIVDDDSPNQLGDIVYEFKDSRISYYRNKHNIGGNDLIAQWNLCLKYAKGDYVILATDDDLYEPNFLSTFFNLINKYPDVQVFRSRIMSINDSGDIMWFDRTYKEFLNQGEFFYYYLQGIMGGIPQFVFKRKSLVDGGGFVKFPIAWGSDDATALKHSYNGIVNSQDMLVKFRWSNVNISSKHDRTTLLKKVEARVQLCQWLKKEIVNVHFSNDAIGQFCYNDVVNKIDIHIKRILIKELSYLSIYDFFRTIYRISKLNLLSKRNICSIIYRCIKNNML